MTYPNITRSELIMILADKYHLTPAVAEQVVKTILEHMSLTLTQGKRIEIRDFGSFELRERPARTARNPKTGETVQTKAKRRVHFKTGRDLRERVNQG